MAIRENARENYDKMTNAKFQILNDTSIKELKKRCKLHASGILGLRHETYDREEFLKNRKEYWESSWDSILKNESSPSDEFMEFMEVVEKDRLEEQERIRKEKKRWRRLG